ncbi:MAG: hypothetical protein GWN76_15585, partial [candidate division Zixibacteria bacterium]|nr:hypothetical protein [candidate division Zixibacteria bacterium]NIR65560.1 hypothetical protein [candidate division Zixibacteria bacterium]NIS47247.1 hypothetical protein [candidate division Zixibacteria bacterium]NIU15386.1 hypothetical protein [candidate division Zixibacteria bacterium]NIX57667.1 hypothetical protein [candidate division Zixibacteria bacterium]
MDVTSDPNGNVDDQANIVLYVESDGDSAKNRAYTSVTTIEEVTQGNVNLNIETSDIRTSLSNATDNETMTIYATVHNR